MSDKNAGHNGTQWTKATASSAAASVIAAQPQQQQKLNPGTFSTAQQLHSNQRPQQQQQNEQRLYDPINLMPAHNSIFGAGVSATLGHSTHPHGIAAYAGARFHPPPFPTQESTVNASNLSHSIISHQQHSQLQHRLQHQQQPSSPNHAPTTVLTSPAAASPGVPVQSGFVPPPLLPGAAAAAAAVAAAATSVLTPNPFAVSPQLDQLTSHLNLQQQFELNKIMTVMNTHPSSINVVGNSVVNVTAGGNCTSSLLSEHQTSQRPSTSDVSLTGAVGSTANSGSGVVGSAVASGTISSTVADNVLSAICAKSNSTVSANVPAVHGRLAGMGVRLPNDDRLLHIQKLVGSGVSESAKEQIQQIIDRIGTLKPVEKLLLYLRLPGELPETDPLRHPQNPLGTRSEINHTINWVRTHLEHDPKVSIPKQDVYNDYIAYCDRLDIKPLSTADFGKVMKQVFPGVRPRRLGTRGHSRYCYAAMRKTTSLDTPKLPQLDTAAVNEPPPALSGIGTARSLEGSFGSVVATDSESWQIIRSWAEKMLNIKVDNAEDLASRIKCFANDGRDTTATSNVRTVSNITHKKYTPREPKEKRLMADMGPLKKRRKKRRKGSSSSESNCSQAQGQPQTSSSAGDGQSSDIKPNLTVEIVQIKQEFLESPTMQRAQHMPAAITQLPQVATMSDSFMQQQQKLQHHQQQQQPLQQQKQQQQQPLQQQKQQQQQQMLPMNLVTEQRTVLARAPPAASAFGVVQSQPQSSEQRPLIRTTLTAATPSTAAVKNLTPKIIELGAAATSASVPTGAGFEMAASIKEEEFLDEYNPNIFCKKVRKAQQTKGFWVNSPTSVSGNVIVSNITTTTASSDVMSSAQTSLLAVATSVIATSTLSVTHSGASNLDTGAAAHDLMGPPAQISSNTSISPSNALLNTESGGTSSQPPTVASPKVLSRNMLQMRARRQQIAAALAAEAAANAAGNSLPDADAGDLPANLGLPRERVISICNMDKHELDDYFVDGEVEEEPEDQDTELLQYFQTRDAEEKLNTSDAVKTKNRHSTVTTTPSEQITLATTASTVVAVVAATSSIPTATSITSVLSTKTSSSSYLLIQEKLSPILAAKEVGSRLQQNAPVIAKDCYSYAPQMLNGDGFTIADGVKKYTKTIGITVPKVNITTTMAVGSASASLTLLSQKHQQQQSHQEQKKQLYSHVRNKEHNSNNSSKRKISLSGTTINAAEVIATRKNCIFFPISPNSHTTSAAGDNNKTNINKNSTSHNKSKSTNSAPYNTSTCKATVGNSGSFFVSPGQSVHRIRPKPAYALTKQLSLDNDSSDPMIGASRRRRSYANLVTSGGCNNTLMPITSSSAPPSPSVLQQQQQKQQYQQMYGIHFLSSESNMEHQTLNAIDTKTSNATTYNHLNNTNTNINAVDLLAAEQNSLDLDMFSTAAARAMEYDELALNELTTPLNEIQRSQSVPLSQLQRIHSPAFNRSFQTATYSACTSVAQTPVSHEYADSSTFFSENSCSQNSGKHSIRAVSTKLLDDEAALLSTDTAAMLDNLDVDEIFSADFLRVKFQNNVQDNVTTSTTKTTCSSAGSSSGYSSSACTTFDSSALISGSGGMGNNSLFSGTGNTTSRSVPSTPLPHQQQHSPFASYFYGGRRRLAEEAHISPSLTTTGNAMGCTFTTTIFKYNNHGGGGIKGNCGGGGFGSTSFYDISRSMPTTPTATPHFRYSPTEFTHEFLNNGNTNTIDSLISGGANTNSLTDAGAPSEGLSDVLTGFTGNNDALIDDNCGLSTDAFVNNTVNDAESMMAEANELLGSL